MKIFKNVLIALGVLVLIALAGIYFLPSHYQVSNTIEINKPIQLVFGEVADFNKWKDWSPWTQMEPTATLTIEGKPGTVGHKMSWSGRQLGEGSATIGDVNPYLGIATDLDFVKPMKTTSKDYWIFEPKGDKTLATWRSSGDLSYPIGRLIGLNMDKIVGVPERHGLENLKKVCEAMAAPVASAEPAGEASATTNTKQ
jgi:hypothetical protein